MCATGHGHLRQKAAGREQPLISPRIPRVCRGLLLLALWPLSQAQNQPDALIICPPNIDFGSQSIADRSQPVPITVRNPSHFTFHFDQIIPSGIDFESRNNCGNELPAGGECTVQVTFKPAISGRRLGRL